MGPLLVVGLLLGTAGFAAWRRSPARLARERLRRARARALAGLLASVGLKAHAIPAGPAAVVSAVSGRLRVTLRDGVEARPFTELLVRVEGGFDLGLRLARDAPASGMEIGDPAFDALFRVEGTPARVRALLDADTRRLMRALGALDFTLDAQALRLRTWLPDEQARVRSLEPLLPAALEVARRLSAPVDLPQRLAANARQEALASVRLHNLLALARDFPEHPATPPALEQARGDRSVEIRLRAAVAAGEAGQADLAELAESATIGAGYRARAVAALGRRLEPGRAHALLDAALASGSAELARACLDVLALEPDARALAAFERVLGSDDEDLAADAARTLGRVASVAAVPALRDLEQRAQRDDTRRAAYQAVAAIQSRAPGATPGQVSLAASETGQIALAGDERGQVSLADDDDDDAAGDGRER